MNRAEKRYFRELVGVRKEADDPLSGSEIDTLGDYVSARGRIDELRQVWKRESERVTTYSLDGRNVLPLARQIDAMTKLSRRLAEVLRI